MNAPRTDLTALANPPQRGFCEAQTALETVAATTPTKVS